MGIGVSKEVAGARTEVDIGDTSFPRPLPYLLSQSYLQSSYQHHSNYTSN